MSVRKNDREKGDLEVINASRILIDYTYDRVRDTKTFPKKERWLMAKNIWDAVVGARTYSYWYRQDSSTDGQQ